MTLTTVAPQITSAGILAPTYYKIVDYLKEQYKAIYGDDAYLENDSQDGQWIGVLARAISDCNAKTIDVYSTFSPKTATGDALSRNVAINGIQRALPTHSTVDLTLNGLAGTVINNGYAIDENNKSWLFPKVVTIPSNGTTIITAIAAEPGAILATAKTVNKIGNPTRGWLSVVNPNTSTLGMPVEKDELLRQRQALSVAISSQSKTDGIKAAVFSLLGVSRCKTYENDTDAKNGLGLPPHSLCVVVSGGDSKEIAQIIRAKKSLGCRLYGNTTITVNDNFDVPTKITFQRPIVRTVGVSISLASSVDYTSDIAESIKQAVSDHINQLDIGDRVSLAKLYVPAGLFGKLDSRTYDISGMSLIVDGETINGDLRLNFNEVAYCSATNIDLNISGG